MLNDRDAKADSAVGKQGKMSEKLSVAVLTPKEKRNRLTAAECLVHQEWRACLSFSSLF